MFQVTMCPSSGETTDFMRHLVLIILRGWLSGMQGAMKHFTLHTSHPHRITSTKCCINTAVSPDDGHSHPKHVEIDKYTKNKYTKNKLCTKLALLTRLYRDVWSKKRKIW